uniref:Uncharacterized protein n=1 Tax=viral metagenome TaxID=1070528 RepID=A0A6C0ICA3_9ZZZZ
MEVIDIGLDRNMENISIQLDEGFDRRPSVNFGPGIELLMNEKKKNTFANTSVDLGELDKLENDLNDLSRGSNSNSNSSGDKTINFGSWFGNNSGSEPAIRIHDESNDSGLGEATANSIAGVTNTSDGFSKLNMEIPMEYSNSSRMTDREKRRKKRAMIKKLEEWYEKGTIKHTSHFNIDSNYDEVEDEYEGALEDKRKKDSVKIYGWWFMTLVNSVEYANSAFNPFDLNLDGWGEQISEDLDSYEELFLELYQKYKGGKIAPEISLLLRLGFSAAVVNFTNKALSTATPAFNDVIRQNPDLMKMFTNATVQSMSQSSPGFNMASQMMNREPEVGTTFGPPPAPVQTKNMAPPQRPQMQQMQFTQRPDIMAGRGQAQPMFHESGIDMQERSPVMSPPPSRPEMRGPQNMDLDNILSGLKTRDVVLHSDPPRQPQQQQQQQPTHEEFADMGISSTVLNENDSMISINSLRDMQNATAPKRARRKQRSDRNTISLDI